MTLSTQTAGPTPDTPKGVCPCLSEPVTGDGFVGHGGLLSGSVRSVRVHDRVWLPLRHDPTLSVAVRHVHPSAAASSRRFVLLLLAASPLLFFAGHGRTLSVSVRSVWSVRGRAPLTPPTQRRSIDRELPASRCASVRNPSVMERYQSMITPCRFEPMTTSGGRGNEPYRKQPTVLTPIPFGMSRCPTSHPYEARYVTF
jgi:hypothetical protein